jgi:hypothetical protein
MDIFSVYRFIKKQKEIMASMSPCTIEKDVLDAMKKFRRLSNKSTMAMLCKSV